MINRSHIQVDLTEVKYPVASVVINKPLYCSRYGSNFSWVCIGSFSYF